MPSRSEQQGFAVPISNPRYSWVESHAITSPLSRLASHTAKADFPEAVGPTTATSGSTDLSSLIGKSNGAREQKEKSARKVRAGDSPKSDCERASSVRIVGLKIIVVRETQLDIRTAECRRQWF